MILLVYLFNLISPIITFIGTFALLFGYTFMEPWMWLVCGASALVGILFGNATWGYGVPPRWFWIKSELELLDNRVMVSLKYAYIFFLIPVCVWLFVEGM